MWGRNRRRAADQQEQVRCAQRDRDRADDLIARIDAQEAEIDARVDRLERRKERNHFAESMFRAMGELGEH